MTVHNLFYALLVLRSVWPIAADMPARGGSWLRTARFRRRSLGSEVVRDSAPMRGDSLTSAVVWRSLLLSGLGRSALVTVVWRVRYGLV